MPNGPRIPVPRVVSESLRRALDGLAEVFRGAAQRRSAELDQMALLQSTVSPDKARGVLRFIRRGMDEGRLRIQQGANEAFNARLEAHYPDEVQDDVANLVVNAVDTMEVLGQREGERVLGIGLRNPVGRWRAEVLGTLSGTIGRLESEGLGARAFPQFDVVAERFRADPVLNAPQMAQELVRLVEGGMETARTVIPSLVRWVRETDVAAKGRIMREEVFPALDRLQTEIRATRERVIQEARRILEESGRRLDEIRRQAEEAAPTDADVNRVIGLRSDYWRGLEGAGLLDGVAEAAREDALASGEVLGVEVVPPPAPPPVRIPATLEEQLAARVRAATGRPPVA